MRPMREYPEAEADFDDAIDLDPSVASYYRNRGWCRCLQKDFDGAVADLNEAIRSDRNIP